MPARPFARSAFREISDDLVHFTKRTGRENLVVPPEIRGMSAMERLAGIVRAGRIQAFHVFGGGALAVICLSEATSQHVSDLVHVAGWEPWGIGFTRHYIYELGGGPAYYVRTDDWRQFAAHADKRMRALAVEFSPGDTDAPLDRPGVKNWTHEREWRVPFTDDYGLKFSYFQISVLVLGLPLEDFVADANLELRTANYLQENLALDNAPLHGFHIYRHRYL